MNHTHNFYYLINLYYVGCGRYQVKRGINIETQPLFPTYQIFPNFQNLNIMYFTFLYLCL